jgi:hypothetical protein
MKSPRWPLWGALLLLVAALLTVLVFLAAEYEVNRDQAALDQDALGVAVDIRSGLLRNVQTLQSLHAFSPTPQSWDAPAAEMLGQRREIVRLEWRDNNLRLLAQRLSPYTPDVFEQLGAGRPCRRCGRLANRRGACRAPPIRRATSGPFAMAVVWRSWSPAFHSPKPESPLAIWWRRTRCRACWPNSATPPRFAAVA